MEHVVRGIIAALLIPVFLAGLLLYMVNSRRGAELLKRLVIVLVAAIVGPCLVASLMKSLAESPWFPVLLLVTVAVAYFIRESRLGRHGRGSGHPSVTERTPVLPTGFDQEPE